MSKVKVSKDVFDAIEFYARKGDNWEEEVLKDAIRCKENLSIHNSAIVLAKKFTIMELAKLLINGCEIELTPLEELQYTYQDVIRNYNEYVHKEDRWNTNYYEGFIKGMEKVSEILNLDVDFREYE